MRKKSTTKIDQKAIDIIRKIEQGHRPKKNYPEKIQFWRSYWVRVSHVDFLDSEIEMINGNSILSELIDEVRYNNLGNSRNKIYFQRQIDFLIEKDPAINKEFLTDFKIVRRELGKPKNEYLIELCKQVKNKLYKFNYFKLILNALAEELTNSSTLEVSIASIKLFSRLIYVEFILKGYSFSRISAFLDDIFDDLFQYDADKYRTKFPHNLKLSDFGDVRDKYNTALQDLMNKISDKERILSLNEYHILKPVERIVIFPIKGLRGSSDFQIGDVNFYSPFKKKLLNESYPAEKGGLYDETFNQEEENHYLNAAIKIDHIFDTEVAKKQAIEKTERAFDVISIFRGTKQPFVVDYEQYIFITLDGQPGGSGSSQRNSEKMVWFDSLELSKKDMKIMEKSENMAEFSEHARLDPKFYSETHEVIFQALRWHRKAIESKRPEDKLLNYWIAIEKVVSGQEKVLLEENARSNKFESALKLTIPTILNYYVFGVAWELRFQLGPEVWNGRIDLPKKLVKDSHLEHRAYKTINVMNFIDQLGNIEKNINDAYFKEKTRFVYEFYYSKETGSKFIEKEHRRITDDLTLIYRMRNRIVHNAHYEIHSLNFLAERAADICQKVLLAIIRKNLTNPQTSFQSLLLGEIAKFELLQERLKTSTVYDVIKNHW